MVIVVEKNEQISRICEISKKKVATIEINKPERSSPQANSRNDSSRFFSTSSRYKEYICNTKEKRY